MDFYIKRNSTLPTLKMKLITDNDLEDDKFNKMLENAAVTFSMVSVDNKTFKIANIVANIVVEKTIINDRRNEYNYYIEYCWKPEDTNRTGTYIGEFKIDFLDPFCGTLIVPIKDKLFIHIQDSITKTTVIK